jgi:FkbM family methyltransferase
MWRARTRIGNSSSRYSWRSLTWVLAFFCAVLVARFIRTLTAPTSSDGGTAKTSTNKGNAALPFPKQCSADQMATILKQLPADTCSEGGNCAMAYATQCSDSVWWDEQFLAKASKKEKTSNSAASSSSSPRVAIYVGCNKGFDAVNALRLLSSDGTYDRTSWSDHFFQGVPQRGWCGQQTGPEAVVGAAAGLTIHNDAMVHCIEPMPTTVAELQRAAAELKWDKRLIVSNVAMSNTDGTALFPNEKHNVGTESTSLDDCTGAGLSNCETVTVSRLDTFISKHFTDPNAKIDFLSIDTEGYDFEVIQGGVNTLKRAKYLEFEYHSTSLWLTHTLSETLAILTDHGFVCYWAGAYGHIWRITNCWHDHYDIHGFSNVACVNLHEAAISAETKALYDRMEDLFAQTLAAGTKINYSRPSSMFSDGGFRYPEFAHMPKKDTWKTPPVD